MTDFSISGCTDRRSSLTAMRVGAWLESATLQHPPHLLVECAFKSLLTTVKINQACIKAAFSSCCCCCRRRRRCCDGQLDAKWCCCAADFPWNMTGSWPLARHGCMSLGGWLSCVGRWGLTRDVWSIIQRRRLQAPIPMRFISVQ